MQRPPTCDHPLREVFDLNKHWPQSRPLPFFTQVAGQKGYKHLYLLEAKPEFYYFVLSELSFKLSFTNKCASITRAEKIITLYVFPSDITETLSQLFFLVTPALFLNCILPDLSLLPHFQSAKDCLMGFVCVASLSSLISYSFVEEILTAAVPDLYESTAVS